MINFSNEIIEALKEPLYTKDIKKIKIKNTDYEYEYVDIEYIITQANKIFGFDGWQRETLYCKEVGREHDKISGHSVCYKAKVRITLFNGIIREGIGYGIGYGKKLFDCVEKAGKVAETDATKRAFRTFGNVFGLALSDKDRENIADYEIVQKEKAEKEKNNKASVFVEELIEKYNVCLNNFNLEEFVNLQNKNEKQIFAIKNRYPDLSKKLDKATNEITEKLKNIG